MTIDFPSPIVRIHRPPHNPTGSCINGLSVKIRNIDKIVLSNTSHMNRRLIRFSSLSQPNFQRPRNVDSINTATNYITNYC